MNRRALLASLTSAPLFVGAGCTSSSPSNQSCGSVSISRASVEVDYECDYGTRVDGKILVRSGDCETNLTLELLDDGDVIRSVDIESDGELWSSSFGSETPGPDLGTVGPGDKKIQVRGPDGDVLATDTLRVDHYKDDLAVEVRDTDFQPETVVVGEPVTVSFTVLMVGSGGGGRYTARLFVGDTVVERRNGSVEGGECEYGREGTAFEATHTFEKPGEYELTVEVIAEDATEPWFSRPIGTVTVEASGQ